MQHPNLFDHARHDTTLIAGHAAGDVADTDRARADALIAECDACNELRRDLVAIAAATRSVPAPATLTRDFRLAPEQAERLRRGSWLRGFLRPFGATGSPFRPMATAFTSLGLVGLVVGIAFSGGLGMAGGAAPGPGVARDNASGAATAAPAAPAAPAAQGNDAQTEGGAIVQVLRASDGTYYLATRRPVRTAVEDKSDGTPSPTSAAFGAVDQGTNPGGDGEETVAPLTTPASSPLIAGSLALLGIGLLLFGLRIASRRVR